MSRRHLVTVSTLSAVVLVLSGTPGSAAPTTSAGLPWFAAHRAAVGKQRVQNTQQLHTLAPGDIPRSGEEPDEIAEQADQYNEARTSPGVVAPGAYSAAWAQLNSLRSTGGRWKDETALPYNADDPRYRDYFSNSSGGAGNVTGRVTGLAADNDGNVYAGAANGGVWRSRTGGGKWEPIADRLPTGSTGDLRLDSHGRLWWATGEANTSATSFVGSGVYVLSDPTHGAFASANRVGGTELESTTIRKLRFIGTTAWVATSRGVWSHSITNLSGPWKLEFAPNPDYLPGGPLAADPNAPYKNIANDLAADPHDPSKIVLAIGWRGGDTYNGFYTKQNGTWAQTTLAGDIASDPFNVGTVTFGFAADGSKAYAIEQSPTVAATNPDTGLKGVYVSANGSPLGPWTLVADSPKLVAAGSGIDLPGYRPGIQSWYNQFLQVDPSDPTHVYLGLEEVFESTDAGATWKAVGPYWNFYFPCWNNNAETQTGNCHQTVHPDQHSVAIGRYHGKSFVAVGDDGGVYQRPLRGQTDAANHATDWKSLNDGTMDVLQYYSVAASTDGPGVSLTGGLQDNGQSLLRAGERAQGSPFGGDGGDTYADPANPCNIAEEYTYLAIRVTNNCAVNGGAAQVDQSKATSYDVGTPDSGSPATARFIAPFSADPKNRNTWVAGGRHVWVQHNGFAIRSGSEWTNVFDLGAGHVATSVAVSDGTAYVGWCGPCNNQGFTRGIAVGKTDGTGWHQLALPVDGTIPNRFVSGFDVDPFNSNHVFVAVNGFSRKWTEGPGAGVGHVFESWNGGASWTDISADLPDVPANAVKIIWGGGLVLGTDLGVFYRAPGKTGWKVLGRNLPTTAVLQLKTGFYGLRLYAATHGRGIQSFDLWQLLFFD